MIYVKSHDAMKEYVTVSPSIAYPSNKRSANDVYCLLLILILITAGILSSSSLGTLTLNATRATAAVRRGEGKVNMLRRVKGK